MAKTIQKKVKFSKGQIVPELAERVDLSILDESAQKMKNVVSTVYGGVRRRRGTKKIDVLYSSLEKEIQSLNPEGFEDKTEPTTSIANNFSKTFDYGKTYSEGSFKIRGIKFLYREPVITVSKSKIASGKWTLEDAFIEDAGLGISNIDKFSCEPTSGHWDYDPQFSFDASTGSVESFTITDGGVIRTKWGYPSRTLTFKRVAEPFFHDFTISVSEDGVVWENVYAMTVVEEKKDFDVGILRPFRYVRISCSLQGEALRYFSVDYTVLSSIAKEKSSKSRFVAFSYNEEEKYLIVLSNKEIKIYQDDIYRYFIPNGFEEKYLDELKWSQKDDSIVFTHQDFPPKILKRVKHEGKFIWFFSDVEIKNTPYTLFGEEEKTKKTGWIKPTGEEGSVKIKSVKSDEDFEEGDDIFTEDMVGQYIDGNGGRAKITEFVSAKELGINTIIPFYTAEAFSEWEYIHGYELAWSEERGYPKTCLFSSQRLWFGGSKEKPSTIWGSRLGDYFDFKNNGNYDNDSIDVSLLTNSSIVNLMDNRGLHIFTSNEEITANEASLTPSGFTATINTKNGSLPKTYPVVLGDGTCVFVEKNGKSLLSYLYDYNQASYSAGNLSLMSNLIEKPVSLVLQRNSNVDKGDFLFVVLESGKMLVNCFLLKENINSMCSFESSGKIKDVCVVGGEVYLLTEYEETLFIEKITDFNTDLTIPVFCNSETVSVLDAFEGKNAVVYDDIKVYGFGRVVEGQIELDEIPNKTCNCGLSFDSELVGNNLAINGKTTNVKKRITKATVVCKPEATKSLVFNGKTQKKKDGLYTFYSCTPYGKEVNFNIRSEFEPFEVYSITLDINYEG